MNLRGNLIANLKRLTQKFPEDVKKAVYLEAQIEMTESKRRVPVDTGVLRASGEVSTPERHGDNVSVVLSYGGAANDYAIPVHENPDAFHPVGQWKYLESVLDESRPHMLARIGARINLNKERP